MTPPPSQLAELDRLFQVSLARFVDERKKLAKELRDAGKRALAKQVAELPKPTPSAWALNQVARRNPGRIEAYCAALDAQIEGHRAGAGREALFAAAAAERDARKQVVDAAVRVLADDGVKASKATLDGLGDLLRDAATDPATRPRLAAGSLLGAQPSDGLAALVARVEPTAEEPAASAESATSAPLREAHWPAPHQQKPAASAESATSAPLREAHWPAPHQQEPAANEESATSAPLREAHWPAPHQHEPAQRGAGTAPEEAELRRAAEETELRLAAEEAERRRAAEEAVRAARRVQLAERERAYERAVAAEREAELELEAAKLKLELAQLRRASIEAALRELREGREPS